VGEEEDIFTKLRKQMADVAQKEGRSIVPNLTKPMVETHRSESALKRLLLLKMAKGGTSGFSDGFFLAWQLG